MANPVMRPRYALALLGLTIAIAAGVAYPAAAQDITTGLVGHWKFDETSGSTAADSSGNGNDGTAVNHSWISSGRVGGCIELDGSGDYVSVVNSTSLQISGDITISAWVKADTVSGNHCIVGHGSTSSAVQNTYLYGWSGDWLGGSQSGGNDEFANANVPSEDVGEWTHLAIVHNGSQWRLYRNGEIFATNDTSQGAENVAGGRWAIGATSGLSSRFFDGQIDDARIYNRALTDADIVELYVDGWATGRMLFVMASSSPTTQEQLRITQFENWGYAVTTVEASDSQSEYDTALVGAGVVYISEAVSSGDVSYKLRETTVGVVNDEPCLADEFGFSTACATNISSQTALTITDNGHFITSPYSTGALTVFDSAQSVAYLSGTLASGLTPLGDWTSNPGLAALDTGATLATTYNSSNTAFGRRVFLGFNGSTDFAELNADGLNLLRRALEWASGVGDLSFGLEAHWTFDEGSGSTIADSSTGGNDASFNNGSPAWITGVRGSALEFDGTNDAITDADFDPPARGSVAYWFRSDGPTLSRERPWGLNADYETWQDTDGLMSFDVSTDGFQGGFITDRPLDLAGNWYHLVAQYDSDSDAFEIYINGVLHKSGVSTWPITDQSAAQLSFGTRTGSTDRFSGALDDFRIYNRWLSTDEVLELYGLVGHWKFDEGSGTTIADSAGDDDASFNTGTPTWVQGVRQGALEFDGTNDAVTDDNFDPPATGAVAFWIRRSTAFSARERPFGVNGNWEARQDGDGSLKFDIGASPFAGNEPFSTTEPIPLQDEWSHVVAQFNDADDTYEVWVDGQLDSSGVSPVDLVGQADGPLTFGARTGSSERFVGALDDFRVYDRWLSHAEIAELYGLVGHWRLDETAGSTASDSSGSGLHGAYSGGVTLGAGGPLSGTVAAEFDGVDDHVNLPDIDFDYTDGIAISGWMRRDSVGTVSTAMLGVSNGQDVDDIWFGWDSTFGIELYLSDTVDGSSTTYVLDNTEPVNGAWEHQLVTVDASGNARLFRDGVESASGFVSLPRRINRSQSFLGVSAWNDNFPGRLHDVRLYNRPLSDAEISDLSTGDLAPGVRVTSWVEIANP